MANSFDKSDLRVIIAVAECDDLLANTLVAVVAVPFLLEVLLHQLTRRLAASIDKAGDPGIEVAPDVPLGARFEVGGRHACQVVGQVDSPVLDGPHLSIIEERLGAPAEL